MFKRNTDGVSELVKEMNSTTLHNTQSPDTSKSKTKVAPSAPKKPNISIFNDPAVVRQLKSEFDAAAAQTRSHVGSLIKAK